MNPHKWTVPTLIAASALFCAAPFPYQWLTGETADWQAWWAFGTFLIALIAALIAYQEYNAHMRATRPQLIASSEQFDQDNSAITLTNVGGGTATAISIKLTPGIKSGLASGLTDADEPVDLATRIPMLEPQTKTYAFDSEKLFLTEMRAAANQPEQTVHIEWNDSAGKHYKDDSLKLDFNHQVIKRNGMVVEHDAKKIQQIKQETMREQKS